MTSSLETRQALFNALKEAKCTITAYVQDGEYTIHLSYGDRIKVHTFPVQSMDDLNTEKEVKPSELPESVLKQIITEI